MSGPGGADPLAGPVNPGAVYEEYASQILGKLERDLFEDYVSDEAVIGKEKQKAILDAWAAIPVEGFITAFFGPGSVETTGGLWKPDKESEMMETLYQVRIILNVKDDCNVGLCEEYLIAGRVLGLEILAKSENDARIKLGQIMPNLDFDGEHAPEVIIRPFRP